MNLSKASALAGGSRGGFYTIRALSTYCHSPWTTGAHYTCKPPRMIPIIPLYYSP